MPAPTAAASAGLPRRLAARATLQGLALLRRRQAAI